MTRIDYGPAPLYLNDAQRVCSLRACWAIWLIGGMAGWAAIIGIGLVVKRGVMALAGVA